MQTPHSTTLREGLAQFRATYNQDLSHHTVGTSEEAQAFFYAHDTAHVLFGCDISLFGEGAVKIWTIFGTTLGFWNHLRAYRIASAFELSKKFSGVDYARHLFRLFTSIPTLIVRANKMYKPWPWADFERYLDVPIADIRKEFGIVVL